MIDASTWASIFSGIKSIQDIIKVFSDKKTQIEANEKIIDLQQLIAETQREHLALIQVKGEMEEKIRQNEEWKETEERYQLSEIGNGRFVYVPKPNSNSTEPTHWCCANCWKEKIKSIFQFQFHGQKGTRHFICPQCKDTFQI